MHLPPHRHAIIIITTITTTTSLPLLRLPRPPRQGEPLLQVAAENAGARVVRLLLEHHESEAYDEDLLSVSLTVACEAANEPVSLLLLALGFVVMVWC